MPASSELLTEVGQRFIALLNDRDLPAAAELYALDASYCSAALVEQGVTDGRIVGRSQIMRFFAQALDGDHEFRLSVIDQFTGLNLIVLISSFAGRTFVDVLRTNDDGLITEHLETTPQPSPGLT